MLLIADRNYNTLAANPCIASNNYFYGGFINYFFNNLN